MRSSALINFEMIAGEAKAAQPSVDVIPPEFSPESPSGGGTPRNAFGVAAGPA